MDPAVLQRLRLFHALAGEARAAASALETLSPSYRVVEGFIETVCRVLAADRAAIQHGAHQPDGGLPGVARRGGLLR